jgi:hypothetical protein
MISTDAAIRAVTELGLLPRFPADKDARIALVRTLIEMIRNAGRVENDTEEQVDQKDEEALAWLVKRANNLWTRWEGIRELRAIYCARFHPADGIESTSAIYSDGVPPDPTLHPLMLSEPPVINNWPKEELHAIGQAWAKRNRFSPAEKRRRAMRDWLQMAWRDGIVLDGVYDDALLGLAMLASARERVYAVYDYEALVECLMDREDLSPEMAEEAVANLASEVLLFLHPPAEDRTRPAIPTPRISQAEIDSVVADVRAQRRGWTPERLAVLEAEAARVRRSADNG